MVRWSYRCNSHNYSYWQHNTFCRICNQCLHSNLDNRKWYCNWCRWIRTWHWNNINCYSIRWLSLRSMVRWCYRCNSHNYSYWQRNTFCRICNQCLHSKLDNRKWYCYCCRWIRTWHRSNINCYSKRGLSLRSMVRRCYWSYSYYHCYW